ncbi:4-coumarate-CoA ligase [Ilyonectria destructans]|nr:4-coumarate-CoA ligase [Ilyonectria destructans]KAH6985259.1 4-coumarate-CoA ligase [Ilyonectria destructans]
MPYDSPYAPLVIPRCNILSYLFPKDRPVSDKPQWIDSTMPSLSLTRVQILTWVRRFAVGLERLGVREGQTVMVFTPNHIFVPLAYLGAAGSKRIFTGVSPSYTVQEVAYQMEAVEPAVVLVYPDLLDTALAAATKAGIPQNRLFQFSDIECGSSRGVQDWRTMCASAAESGTWDWDPLTGDTALSTPAAINFSSGTTGLPKGVCISHHNLVANTMQTIFNRYESTQYSDTNPAPETWLTFLPLYHAYSQLWTINIACRLQIPVYIMPKFKFQHYLESIERFKVTALQTVPPILVMLTKRFETYHYDLSSVRHILTGAAPLPVELQNEVARRFNLVVTQGWGMTETTCSGIMNSTTVSGTSGSVGCLLPNTQAVLVDEQQTEILDAETPGELWVRGPQMMLGYWRNESATNETKTSDGWVKTGDIARFQGGKFWIVDRKKELIKVNSLQVSPAELESVLLEHEAVVDAAVVGMSILGEEKPRAYIVLREPAKGKVTRKDIELFVASRVAKHKALSGGVQVVDEIPRLASGKIIRKLMKEWGKRDARKEMERRQKEKL